MSDSVDYSDECLFFVSDSVDHSDEQLCHQANSCSAQANAKAKGPLQTLAMARLLPYQSIG